MGENKYIDDLDQFYELPYPKRQKIVFRDESKPVPISERLKAGFNRSSGIAPWVLGPLSMGFGIGVPLAVEVINAALEWQEKRGREFLRLGLGLAKFFEFQPGHPLVDRVYVAHPIAGVHQYIQVEDFHRFLFEHKFAECVRILQSLVATRISVELIKANEGSVTVKTESTSGLKIDSGNLEISRNKSNEKGILTEMNFNAPSAKPDLPEDLVWLNSEPIWQTVVDGRLKYGLRDFLLKVRTMDDYGITVNLAKKLKGFGVVIVADFNGFQATEWKLSGEFAPIITP